jgi:bacterioferritin
MQGDARVIELLNEALANELTATSQYYDLVIERLLFLEGRPNMSQPSPLNLGASLRDQYESDLRLETQFALMDVLGEQEHLSQQV